MDENTDHQVEEADRQRTQREIRKSEAALEKAIFLHEWRNASKLHDNDSTKHQLASMGNYTSQHLWSIAMNTLSSLYRNTEGWRRHSAFLIPLPWRTPAVARMMAWLTMYGFTNDVRELDGTHLQGMFDGQIDTRILIPNIDEDENEGRNTTSIFAPVSQTNTNIFGGSRAPPTASEGAGVTPIKAAAGTSKASTDQASTMDSQTEVQDQQVPSQTGPTDHLLTTHAIPSVETDTEVQDSDPESNDRGDVVANLDGANASPQTSWEDPPQTICTSWRDCLMRPGAPPPQTQVQGGLPIPLQWVLHNHLDALDEAASAAQRRASIARRFATSRRKRKRLKLL
jgi:hypothetical protein